MKTLCLIARVLVLGAISFPVMAASTSNTPAVEPRNSAPTNGAPAKATTGDAATSPPAKTNGKEAVPNPGVLGFPLFVSSGAEFLNPYKVLVNNSTKTGVMTNTGSSTAGFLEFKFIGRYAFKGPQAEEGNMLRPHEDKFPLGGHWVNPLATKPDVEFTVGFIFGNSTSGSGTNSQYSASTLAGAEDFYTEGSMGLPVIRDYDTNTMTRQQVSLELGIGVVTEKNFLELHPNYFVGLGYQRSFNRIGGSTNSAQGIFRSRLGAGWLQWPETTGNNLGVRVDGNGLPMFKTEPALSICASLAYPITDAIYMFVDVNTYFRGEPPDAWNVRVGASVALEKVFGALIGTK